MSIFNEIIKRRVPQIISSYFIAGTSLILFLDWLIIRYKFPEEYITLCLFALISIVPSVIILAYFHGAPGKDEWTKIEKIGVPINIIFILFILILGHNNQWLASDSDKKSINTYLINISSSDLFINNYYTDYGYNSLFYSSEKHIVSKIDKEILNEIKLKLQQRVIYNYAATPINIEINFNSAIEQTLDSLTFPKHGGIQGKDETSVFKKVVTTHSPMYKNFKKYLNTGLFRILIYNVHAIQDNEDHIIIDPAFQVSGKNSWQSFSEYKYDEIDNIIDYLYKYIKTYIQHTTYSSSQIGEIVDIIDSSLVKIKEYKSGILTKGLQVRTSRNYKWSKGGAEIRIEDLEHLKDFFKVSKNKEKIINLNKQIHKIDENIRNKSYRDDTHSVFGGDISYRMEIIDVIDSIAIAKIISNDNQRFIVRKGDIINLENK